MSAGVYELINGLCALIGALLIWRFTGNFLGWLVLFAPGAYLTMAGLWKVARDRS